MNGTQAVAAAIYTQESGIVGGVYATAVAHILREGKMHEKNYAKSLRVGVAMELAIKRTGKAWGELSDVVKREACDKAEYTAKRYTEKAVRVAVAAADKGLALLAVTNADTLADATKVVKAWLTVELGLRTQEDLLETFGFSKAAPKSRDAAPAPVTDATPAAAAEPEAAPATVTEAVRTAESPAEAADTLRAMMQAMPEDVRREFARLILEDVREAAGVEAEATA